ncbi:MAG: hypothetical protein CR997_04075 [Acidobacteria bacterium]|nr:MAG: hypothetical protein CR997_04075 [Acidobacteriota bacterium]
MILMAFILLLWGANPADRVSERQQAVSNAALPGTLSLSETIDLALTRNVLHQSVLLKRDEVKGGIKEARSAAFPQVTLKGSYSQTRSPSMLNSKDFENFIEQFPDGSFNPQVQPLHLLTLEVHQPLFTWGKVKSAIQLAEIVADIAEYQIQASKLNTAHKAASDYFLYQTTLEALRVEEQQREVLAKALELVQVRFELGQATRLEVLRAESACAELEPQVLQRQSDVSLAKRTLLRTLNLPSHTDLKLDDTLFDFPELPPLRHFKALALKNRPELREMERQKSSLEKQSQIENSVGKPNLEFNGSFGREGLYIDRLGKDRYNSWSASVNMSWKVFDGGNRNGKVARLKSQVDQTELQRINIVSEIEYQVEQAWLVYQTSLEKLTASELGVRVSKEALSVAESNYREGISVQTDWLDAQQIARKAKLDLLITQLNTKQAQFNLLRAIGNMPLQSWQTPLGDSK